jgi:hypothetical protein
MVNLDEDDVEVVYDVPFGTNNSNNKQSKGNRGGGRSNNTNTNNNGGGGGGGGVRSNNSNNNNNNNNNNNTSNHNHSGGGGSGSNGMIGNYVDFENVFDPFERDKDDVREFFDEDQSQEDTYDVEKPNMFNDPRKVCSMLFKIHLLIDLRYYYYYYYCYCHCIIIVLLL